MAKQPNGDRKRCRFFRDGRSLRFHRKLGSRSGRRRAGVEALAALAQELEGPSPKGVGCKGVLSVISGPGYKSATINYVRKIDGLPIVQQEHLSELASLAAQDADKCRNKSGGKGTRPYSTSILREVEAACGYSYLQADGPARHREFSVMLDHAARRVNVAHSWIKNAEAERREFEEDAHAWGMFHPRR